MRRVSRSIWGRKAGEVLLNVRGRARMKAYAPDMYQLLKDVLDTQVINRGVEVGEQLEDAIYAALSVIDGTEDEDE